MANFHEGYIKYCKNKGASPALRTLLSVVYNHIHASSLELPLLKNSLFNLVSFLCQPKNRSHTNCLAVDLFFTMDDHWKLRWEHLPKEYQLVLDDIGGNLHDAVSAPNIAENFNSTPEQLLKRIQQLKI